MKMLIKPAVPHAVPKPDGTALKAGGEMLEVNAWWRRRLADGDVTISTPPKKQAVKATSKEA